MDNKMQSTNTQNDQLKSVDQPTQPNENSGIHVQSHIKIFDPDTKEIFLAGRA